MTPAIDAHAHLIPNLTTAEVGGLRDEPGIGLPTRCLAQEAVFDQPLDATEDVEGAVVVANGFRGLQRAAAGEDSQTAE